MSLLDLPGPQFLFAYALAATCLCAALAALLPRGPEDDGGRERIEDALDLACLRGGPAAVVEVAIFSLLDRRLLKASGGELTATALEPAAVRRPVEQALLLAFREPRPAAAGRADAGVAREAEQIRAALERRRLVPPLSVNATRRTARIFAVVALLGLAGAKVAVALSRGRHNLFFLLLAAAAASFAVLFAAGDRHASAKGRRALASAATHFARLKERAADLRTGGEGNELALLAGLFGFAALPPLANDLLREARLVSPPSGGGSGCASSCGGSSCGGGCGGGCGGCS